MSADAGDPPGLSPGDGPFLGEPELQAARAGIAAFVRERIERADATGVVVGLSGGVDSTLSATLAVEALGSDRVFGLSMPWHKTDRLEANEARTIAEGLGIEFDEVPLRSLHDRFASTVGEALAPDADRHTLGNAAARLRMLCLYYVANARSCLVLGTANRSELLTGYFTKNGDGGADLFPLGGLYKTEVRALAHRAGVPRRIVAKPSTAGFWVGQTDADELGAHYEVVDVLLHLVIDEGSPWSRRSTTSQSGDRRRWRSSTDAWTPLTSARPRRCTRFRIGDRATGVRPTPTPTGTDWEALGRATERQEPRRTARECPPRTSGRTSGPKRWTTPGSKAVGMPCSGHWPTDTDVLYDREGAIAPAELVPAIVGRATEHTAATDPSSAAAGVSVVHVHLPTLVSAGLVDYDRDARTVHLTELAERLRPVLHPLLG